MTDIGFNFIKEMSKEELIDEIITHQRTIMQESTLENLRANVVDLRVKNYKDRLCNEAGLVGNGIFGYAVKDEEDEEE
jgi:hypothetical protein